MIPLQGAILILAVFSAVNCEDKTTSADTTRKTRGLLDGQISTTSYVSFLHGDKNINSVVGHPGYGPSFIQQVNALSHQVSPFQPVNHQAPQFLQPLISHDVNLQPNSVYQPNLFGHPGVYNFPVEGIKRYAVKEDVDEGYVTTQRPVYLPRPAPKSRTTPLDNSGWTPIQPKKPTKAIFFPHQQVEAPFIKTNVIPVEKYVGVPIPEPYQVPVIQPYPVAVPEPYPIQVPVPVHVHGGTVEVPVEKPVPVPVIKHVPYSVVKNEPVAVPHPYPVPVPLYKTKYIIHSKSK